MVCVVESPPTGVTQVLASPQNPIDVSDMLMGIHFDTHIPDWWVNPDPNGPQGGDAIAAPSYAYDTARTLGAAVNGNEEVWFLSRIAPDPVNNPTLRNWVDTDAWAAQNGGKPILWVIYGPHEDLALYNSEPGRWNYAGVASPPTAAGHAFYAGLIAEVLARYPEIYAVEVSNEPTFPWSVPNEATNYTDRWTPQWAASQGLTGVNALPFFNGSPIDLARWIYEVQQASSVPVYASGFTDQSNSNQYTIERTFNAPIVVNGVTTTAKNYVDGISLHRYDYGRNANDLYNVLKAYIAKLQALGLDTLPRILSEVGGDISGTFAVGDTDEKDRLMAWALVAAACGMQSIYYYKHGRPDETLGYLGDPVNNPDVISAFNMVATMLSSERVCNGWLRTDGTVTFSVDEDVVVEPPNPVPNVNYIIEEGVARVVGPICIEPANTGPGVNGFNPRLQALVQGVAVQAIGDGRCFNLIFDGSGATEQDIDFVVLFDDCEGTKTAPASFYVNPDGGTVFDPCEGKVITAISLDPDPLLIDAGDTGIIKVILTGGYNDGTDVITKQWNMPNWMNGGDVEWNATDGYHIPYTVPGSYWADKDVDEIDMSVQYTASNDCTTATVTEELNITIKDEGGGGGVIITPGDCNECNYPSNTLTTQAQYVADMIGNNGGDHDESPLQSLNGANRQGNGRFNGSFYTQSGLATIATVPSGAILGQPIIFDHGIAWYVVYAQQGHQPNLNYGVMMSPLEVWFWLKSANGWRRQRRTNWQIKYSDLYVSPWNAADSNSYGAGTGSVGDCKSTKFNPTFWDSALEDQGQTRQGIMGHGYSNHDSINAGDLCGVMVRTWAWLACFDPNGPNDIASAKYQLGLGYDFKSFNNNDNLKYLPAAGGARQKTVTATPQLFTFTTQIGARELLGGSQNNSNPCYLRPLADTFDSTFPFVFE